MKIIVLVMASLSLVQNCNDKKQLEQEVPVVATELTSELSVEISEEKITAETSPIEIVDMVEYTALSRGYYFKITYKNNTLSFSKDRDNLTKATQVVLSSTETTELNKLIAEVNPAILPNLKSPTEKRMYDGAAHANLVIVTKGKQYDGAGFDGGFPPAEIKKLVDKLIQLAEKK